MNIGYLSKQIRQMAFVRRRLASESAAALRPNLFLVRDFHLASGTGVIAYQLSLETQIFEACQSLLPFYQDNEDWAAVGQLALTLASNKDRIYKLQQQFKSAKDKEMDPEAWPTDKGANLTDRVRVRQVVHQDSDNSSCYYMEVEGSATSVLHTSEEFEVLRNELEAKGLLLGGEIQTLRGECEQLSYMLSRALAHPVLCRDPSLIHFMAGDSTSNHVSGNIYGI